MKEAAPPGPAHIITIVNQKGGAAKTTTAMNLAGVLALLGRPVLCVDLDRQATMTKLFGLRKVPTDLFTDELEPLPTRVANLNLIPGGPSLVDRAMEFNFLDRLQTLTEKLRGFRGYEFILLDCPPDIYGVTKSAIVAADQILIPSRVAHDVTEISETLTDMEQLRRQGFPITERVAAVGTQFERTIDQRSMLSLAQRKYVTFWRETVIRKSVLYGKAAINGKWLPASVLGSKGTAPRKDHEALAHELGLL